MLESIHLNNSANEGSLIFLILSISLFISISIIVVFFYLSSIKSLSKNRIEIKNKHKKLDSFYIKILSYIQRFKFPTIELNVIFFIWNIFIVLYGIYS